MKAVILAGGHGTRLHPLSTKEKPKQFLNLIGEKTLFQQTVERVSFLRPEDIFVATNKEFIGLVREQAPEIPLANIFEEPAMRNTATCIGFAAMKLSGSSVNGSTSTSDTALSSASGSASKIPKACPGKLSSDSQSNPPSSSEVMCVIYADHLVHNTDEFARCLRAAELLAKEENTLNIIEVRAESPNTKLGYVQTGKLLREIHDPTTGQPIQVFELKKFKEKPDLATAEEYLASGDYLWNTGFYVWQIETILEKYRLHLPDTYARLMKMREDPSCIATEYPLCESISIDYAIMEKVAPEEVRIIPASDLGWSDIGTWESLFEELEKVGDFERIEKFKKMRESA